MTNETGGPAFPINANESADRCIYTGMTLRDYFAAKAMQGLFASGHYEGLVNPRDVSETAFKVADAMLKARGQ